MPATPLAFFSVAPAAGTAPGANLGAAGGQGAAAGFEALLASLFGAVAQDPAVAETPAVGADDDDEATAEADAAGDAAVPADMQALAALLIASQQQSQPAVQPPPQPEGEIAGQALGAAPAAPPALPLPLPTAPAVAAEEIMPDAVPAEPAAVDMAALEALSDAPKAKADPLALAADAPAPAQAPKPAPVAIPQVQAAQAQAAPVQAALTEAQAAELPAEAAAQIDDEAPATEPVHARGAPRASQAKAAAAEQAVAPQTDAAIAPASTASSSAQAKSDKNGGEEPLIEVRAAAVETAGPDLASDQPDGVAQSTAAADIAGAQRPHHNAAAMIRGAPETVANLAAEILKKLEGRTTRFDVELDPIGLGRVDVRVEIGAQGRLTAALAFDNPQAAAELKNRAGELQRALEQAGFDLSGGLSFDFNGGRGQSGQGLAGQQQDNPGAAWGGRAFQAALDVAGEASETVMSSLLQAQRRTESGLDIRI